MRARTKVLIEWAKEHFNLYSIELHTKPKKHGLGPEWTKKRKNFSCSFCKFS